MQRLVLTLEAPAANLALDEALLDWAEDVGPEGEVLRLWESPQPMIVLGRSSRLDQEVDATECAARGIPILRRASGGAAIVAGPGCLMYAVVLNYDLRPELRGIPQTHCYVPKRIADTLAARIPTVRQAGTSDLVAKKGSELFSPAPGVENADNALRENRSDPFFKFSGNSLRVKRTHCLYHGTLLYDFDLSLITACLKMPARQPDYRSSRAHADFVANLPLTQSDLCNALMSAWPTSGDLDDWPRARVDELIAERYGRDDWNLTFGDGK
jgi:lipoate-protein ligase A